MCAQGTEVAWINNKHHIDMTKSQKFYIHFVKRPIGFLGALTALILLSPIFIATMILLHFSNILNCDMASSVLVICC